MAKQRPWWANRPGRWWGTLEDALASMKAPAVGLAWAIILETGGEDRGCIAEFCRKAKLSQSAVDNGLKGKSFGDKQQRRVVQNCSKVRDDLFDQPRHPFSLEASYLGGRVEPGDAVWAGFWEILAEREPGRPKVSDIRRDFPKLFPDVT